MDADEPYRWRLWRRWAEAPPCVFVMLNPSTADDRHDDPTIRRCVGFARAWGFGGVEVVNLFALRATDPADLRAAAAPVGAGNDAAIAAAVARGRAGAIVVAWGVHGALHGRDREVAARLAPYRPRCLGVTRDGAPRHPLYVRADARAVPWSPPRPAPSRSGR
ncbi:MAG: DUF1643 domain-containing protein [Kofleriaceae bacterium]|nr:DUF1643 domain-containing protein [Kofleriaceae bacterium]